MAQVAALVAALKAALKSSQLTYASVATALGISESSVKRKFSRQEFSLTELDQICSLSGIEFSELVKMMERRQDRLRTLTVEQEREIAEDMALLLVAVCVLNGWSYDNIIEFYVFKPHQLVQKLARLDRLRIIELQANNRIKLLVAPNFSWLPNGPIQRVFLRALQQDFFSARFEREDHELIVLNGMLCESSNAELRRKMDRFAREFDQLNQEDSTLPFARRQGYTVVLALRDWHYRKFASLRLD